MKKLIVLTILLSFISNIAFANCDWSTIKQLPDGGYEYSAELNICVGKLVQTNKLQLVQIEDLTKAIQLKDLALTNADARTQLWMTTAQNEQDRLSKISSAQSHSDFLYFGLGALTVIGAGFMTARLIGR